MSDTYPTSNVSEDTTTTRELGAVDTAPASGTDTYGTDSHGTDSPISGAVSTTAGAHDSGSTTDVAKDEARATGQQAKEGVKHVAEVGKDEAKNVVQETGQQAKELWQQTRTQLMDQSAQQQTRVAEGIRSLSQELSGMAHGAEQQGVASDLAQQASQRMDAVAGWLDQRDPGSLVSEVKQFARQRPGTFLAAAAVIGLVGGRLSRGLVADHQDQTADSQSGSADAAAYGGTPTGATTGYGASSAYSGTTGASSGTSSSYSGTHTDRGQSAIADPDAFPA